MKATHSKTTWLTVVWEGLMAVCVLTEAAHYSRTAEPSVQPASLLLPPGAVEPSGWLRDRAQAVRDGITGHLDERHPTFADGWKGTPIKAMASLLSVSAGEPLLLRAQTVFDTGGRAFEYAQVHYVGSRFAQTMDLRRDDDESTGLPAQQTPISKKKSQ